MSYKRLTLSLKASKEDKRAYVERCFVDGNITRPSQNFLKDCYERLVFLEDDIECGKFVNKEDHEEERERFIKNTARVMCCGHCERNADECNLRCKYKDYATLLWNAKEYKP